MKVLDARIKSGHDTSEPKSLAMGCGRPMPVALGRQHHQVERMVDAVDAALREALLFGGRAVALA